MALAELVTPHAQPDLAVPAVSLRDLTVAYRETPVLWDIDLDIPASTLTAIIGPNGAGKSTLIKLLSGTEPLTGGDYKLGHNVEIDYFAQDQYKELDPNA